MAKDKIIKYATMTVNETKKTITIDTRIPVSRDDKELMVVYVQGGYVVKQKSIKKSNQAKERAEKQLADDDILKALANDEANLKKYVDLKSEKGFFSARAWYRKEILKETPKTKKK